MIGQVGGRVRLAKGITQDANGVCLLPVLAVASPVAGGQESLAGAAHDGDVETAEGPDLHQQAQGVAGVDDQGEGSDKTGFVGDSQCLGHRFFSFTL
jgi:hypothetical protein